VRALLLRGAASAELANNDKAAKPRPKHFIEIILFENKGIICFEFVENQQTFCFNGQLPFPYQHSSLWIVA